MTSASILASTTPRAAAVVPPFRRGGSFMNRASTRAASMIPAKASTEGDAQAGFPEEMRAACEAVRLASMICVETQRTLTSAEKVSKSDDSPVTVADFAAQALVTSVLEKSHPDIEMVAEESADDLRGDENAPLLDRVTSLVNKVLLMSTDEENGDAEADKVVRLMFNEEVADAIDIGGKTDPTRTGKYWILDPIDGTKGFINKRQYAIALALMDDGEIVGGVLGCPNMPSEPIPPGATEIPSTPPGVVFFAFKNKGTWMAPMTHPDPTGAVGDGRITFSATDAGAVMRVCTEQSHTTGRDASYMESWGDSIVADHDATNKLTKALGVVNKPVRIDSMAKYGALARGDTDMYLRFPPNTYREKVWDHAAGAAVVVEAGGVITDGAGNELDFANGRFLDVVGGIVASSTRELHDNLLRQIEAQGLLEK